MVHIRNIRFPPHVHHHFTTRMLYKLTLYSARLLFFCVYLLLLLMLGPWITSRPSFFLLIVWISIEVDFIQLWLRLGPFEDGHRPFL